MANAGDCRIVISQKGVATALTTDHCASREDERARIENSVRNYSYFLLLKTYLSRLCLISCMYERTSRIKLNNQLAHMV